MQGFTEQEVGWVEKFSEITDQQVDVLKEKVKCNLTQCIKDYQNDPMNKDQIKIGVGSFIKSYGFRILVISQDEMKYEIGVRINGIIDTVMEVRPVDIEAIEANCILQKMDKGTGFVYYDDTGVLMYNDHEVKVYHLGNNLKCFDSHDPFGKYKDYYLHDRYTLFPEYDIDIDGGNKLIAFVANRYAWGMNVSVGFFDPNERVIYCGRACNYDYPVGIALRKVNKPDKPTQCHIYLSNRDKERRLVYKDPSGDSIPFIDHLYNDSNWCNLSIEKDFHHLSECIKWLKKQNAETHEERIIAFQQKIEELVDLSNQFDSYLYSDNHDKCLEMGNKFISDPGNHIYKLAYGRISECLRKKYDMACCDAKSGKPDDAMKRLLDIENEWTHWDHMESDEDLESLHQRDDFEELLARH